MIKLKKFFQIARVLIPNWSFFENIGDQLILQIEMKNSSRQSEIDFNFSLKPHNIFVNAQNNFIMAEKNVLEHFVADLESIQNHQHIQNLSSYKILISIIKNKCSIQSQEFRFKITHIVANTSSVSNLYMSEWIKR